MEIDFDPDDLEELGDFLLESEIGSEDGRELDESNNESGNEADDSSSNFDDQELYKRFIEQFRGTGQEYDPPDSDLSDNEVQEGDEMHTPQNPFEQSPQNDQFPAPEGFLAAAPPALPPEPRPPAGPQNPINVWKMGDRLPKDSSAVASRIAQGLPVHQCEHCYKRYCRATDLAKHKQNFHYSEPQLFRCDKCGHHDFKHASVMQYHYENAQCERVWEPGKGIPEEAEVQPPGSHVPKKENEGKSPLALYLQAFLPAMRIWLDNTNKRGQRLFPEEDQVRKKQRKWTDVTVREGLSMIKLVLAWSLVAYKDARDPWRGHKLFNNSFFTETMSGNRYQQIKRATCFCDPDICQLPGGIGFSGGDRYHPFWRVLDLMQSVIGPAQNAMEAGQLFVVDETMLKYEGCNKFVSYMPAKPVHRGFKFYVLCDPETGYLYNFLPCCGYEYRYSEELGLLNATVVELLAGDSNEDANNYLDLGHILTGDNMYTEFGLIEWLKFRLTYYIGTLRRKRRVPEWMEDLLKEDRKTPMIRGEAKYAVSNSGIQMVTWYDSKRVTVASTVPHIKGESSYCWRRVVHKISRLFLGFLAFIQPRLVQAYNKWMGGVDLLNQVVSNYDHHFKCRRWTLCIFMRIINFCCFNSYVIWRHFNRKTDDPKNQWTSREFRLWLITELDVNLKGDGDIDLDQTIDSGQVVFSRNPPKEQPKDWSWYNAVQSMNLRRKMNDSRKMLSHGHSGCRFGVRKVCMVCKDRNHKTNYGCKKCKVTLHVGCFEFFHASEKNF